MAALGGYRAEAGQPEVASSSIVAVLQKLRCVADDVANQLRCVADHSGHQNQPSSGEPTQSSGGDNPCATPGMLMLFNATRD